MYRRRWREYEAAEELKFARVLGREHDSSDRLLCLQVS